MHKHGIHNDHHPNDVYLRAKFNSLLGRTMIPHPDASKAIRLMGELMRSVQREFGHAMVGKTLASNQVNYPNHPEETASVRQGVKQLLEGALLVYLFAMWESHTPQDASEWLTEEERRRLDAFAHVRDSVAHKYKGGRADFARKRRAFEKLMPFAGITWNRAEDRLDIADSSVAWECFHFMQELSKHLVVRLHTNRKPSAA